MVVVEAEFLYYLGAWVVVVLFALVAVAFIWALRSTIPAGEKVETTIFIGGTLFFGVGALFMTLILTGLLVIR